MNRKREKEKGREKSVLEGKKKGGGVLPEKKLI